MLVICRWILGLIFLLFIPVCISQTQDVPKDEGSTGKKHPGGVPGIGGRGGRHHHPGGAGGRGRHHKPHPGHRNTTHMETKWPGVLPSKSLYNGFSPPDDLRTWQLAVQLAAEGDQVLLKEVLKVIKSPDDLFLTDAPEFKWVSNMADIKIGKDNSVGVDGKTYVISGKDLGSLSEWNLEKSGRAAIVNLGTRYFQRERGRRNEGGMTKWSPYGYSEVKQYIDKNPGKQIFATKSVGS